MLDYKLYQLNTLVLCDVAPAERPDAFYIFAEPASFLGLLCDAVCAVADSRKIKIAINGGVGQGYDFRIWHKRLRENGIKEENIILIAPPDGELNTATESEKLAQHAKMFGWKNIWITAPPYQQTRAFMNLVSFLKKEFYPIKVYNLVALPLNWHKEIIHYHGETKGRPVDFIRMELEGIQKYTAEGKLLPAEQILHYLEERESL